MVLWVFSSPILLVNFFAGFTLPGGFVGRFPYFGKMSLEDVQDRGINVQIQAWKNRQNTKVYQIFSEILGTEKLWASLDRYGIMRPIVLNGCALEQENEQRTQQGIQQGTQQDKRNSEDGQESEQQKQTEEVQPKKKNKALVKEEWMTKKNWLHWDLSPFHYGTSAAGFAPNPSLDRDLLSLEYGGLRVQGLITLVDCPIEVGGFHCVPQFHGKRFFEWAKQNTSYGESHGVKHRNFVEVPDDDPMRQEVTKVPMKAGSLLIWNSQLPHGNFPNTSDKFRMVQYIKCIDATSDREFLPVGKIKNLDPRNDIFPPDLELSELGMKLFGLKDW